MIFNSVTYLLFLAAFVLLYWQLPRRPRHWLIFLGSLSFYGFWRIEYCLVMLLSISVDYVAALAISRHAGIWPRRLWLGASLAVNLGLLLYFKYTMFLVDSWASFAQMLGMESPAIALSIILPLGISFYTFQSVSYTVDVFRKQIPAEPNYLCFANFVLFFPQLVAGPILRAVEIIGQLKERPPFALRDLSIGLSQIATGLFLKVVLADNLAPLVDEGFSLPTATLMAKETWALASLFGYQIYFDFAGYSLIAIGSARLMGVHFPENFNFPYVSRSPREFWRRWHISLSSWIRDYLYLPLTGAKFHVHSVGGLGDAAKAPTDKQGAVFRASLALVLTWFIMGLWHGANWTFALWGIWHAGLILGYRFFASRVALPHGATSIIGWIVTYPLIMLSWIPFRAASVDNAITLMMHSFTPASYLEPFALPRYYYTVAALLPLIMLSAHAARSVWPYISRNLALAAPLRLLYLTAMLGMVFVFLRPIRQFIYFQF